MSSLRRHTRAWWRPEHQNPTEGIGPFFLLYLQPQNAATANPQQVHHSSGSLHTTSAQNKPRSSTQASTLSSVSDHQRPLSTIATHISTKPGLRLAPTLLTTKHLANLSSCDFTLHKLFTVDALMNLQVSTRYGIHLADHDQGRPPQERDRTPSLTENLAFCTSLP
jgi:hypothetical protein